MEYKNVYLNPSATVDGNGGALTPYNKLSSVPDTRYQIINVSAGGVLDRATHGNWSPTQGYQKLVKFGSGSNPILQGDYNISTQDAIIVASTAHKIEVSDFVIEKYLRHGIDTDGNDGLFQRIVIRDLDDPTATNNAGLKNDGNNNRFLYITGHDIGAEFMRCGGTAAGTELGWSSCWNIDAGGVGGDAIQCTGAANVQDGWIHDCPRIEKRNSNKQCVVLAVEGYWLVEYSTFIGVDGADTGFTVSKNSASVDVIGCEIYGFTNQLVKVDEASNTVQNIRFYANLLRNSAKAWNIFETAGTVTIANNTVVDVTDGLDANGSSKVNHYNNIYNTVTGIYVFKNATATLDSENNCYGDDHANCYTIDGTSYSTLAALQAGETIDQLSIVGDPLFVDATAGDYRLQDSSPCRGAGTAWWSGLAPKDRLSTSYHTTSPSMGAYSNSISSPAGNLVE